MITTNLDGAFFLTVTRGKAGTPEAVESGDLAPLKLQQTTTGQLLVFPVEVALHRTINMGNFQSARVTCRLAAFVPPDDVDETDAILTGLVHNWLQEEVAKAESNIQKTPAPPQQPFVWPSAKQPTALLVGLEYGITKNLGNFESAKADIGRVVPCLPEDLDEVREELRVWITGRVKRGVALITGKPEPVPAKGQPKGKAPTPVKDVPPAF